MPSRSFVRRAGGMSLEEPTLEVRGVMALGMSLEEPTLEVRGVKALASMMREAGGWGSVRILTSVALLSLSASAWVAPFAHAEVLTFGKATIGQSSEAAVDDHKRVNEYQLPTAGAVSQLSIYLEPTAVSGEQSIEGIIYSDSNGKPGTLVGVSGPSSFASTQSAGWYTLVFPSAVNLPAGDYWIGVITGDEDGVAGYRYDTGAGSKAWNQNEFDSRPSTLFGASSREDKQMSLYATYTASGAALPTNTSPPSVSGTAQQGQTLIEVQGSWGNEPTSFEYQWLQCDGEGNNCNAISGATAQSYVPVADDVGHEIRVRETGSNAGGSASAISEPTQLVAAQPPPENEFVGSIDTMKLSKDKAGEGFTSSHGQAVDLGATMPVSHITVDWPLEDNASGMEAWANRIHADGKHVWFRLTAPEEGGELAHGDLGDGYPTFLPGYLTTLHNVMVAHPGAFKAGDILDGDAEAENSTYWKDHYGCGVQGNCTPCDSDGSNIPCAPVLQFNNFLVHMTEQENRDLAAAGISGVDTTVHSTDPGTAQDQLYPSTVAAMGNKITVDAYPDESAEDSATAAAAWTTALASWHQRWLNKGIDVKVLVGEWGYSNAINVGDATQEAVVLAETQAFTSIPYLLGTNYWVGPGAAGDGGFTQIFYQDSSGVWQFRPAANDVANFYAVMKSGWPGRV